MQTLLKKWRLFIRLVQSTRTLWIFCAEFFLKRFFRLLSIQGFLADRLITPWTSKNSVFETFVCITLNRQCIGSRSNGAIAGTSKKVTSFLHMQNFWRSVLAFYQFCCKFWNKSVLMSWPHQCSVCRFKSQPYLAPSSGISIVWRADSWGAACCQRQLSALQTMEMPLDGAKYGWFLNLQTLFWVTSLRPCKIDMIWIAMRI